MPRKSLTSVKSAAVALAERRDEQAHQAWVMRQDGKSWYAIGKALGLTESMAQNVVRDALTQAAAYVSQGSKQELLELEIARLDRLQESVWTAAMAGNIRAGEFALKVIHERIHALQLDDIADTTITNNTLVVTGSSEEYVAALRAIAGGNQ